MSPHLSAYLPFAPVLPIPVSPFSYHQQALSCLIQTLFLPPPHPLPPVLASSLPEGVTLYINHTDQTYSEPLGKGFVL